jgi:hypothetical protein
MQKRIVTRSPERDRQIDGALAGMQAHLDGRRLAPAGRLAVERATYGIREWLGVLIALKSADTTRVRAR